MALDDDSENNIINFDTISKQNSEDGYKIVENKCRKWLITINNPEEHGLTYQRIQLILSELKSLEYYCMSTEIGLKEQTPHIHIFIYCRNQVRFSRLKTLLPMAHLNKANGSVSQNKDYVAKIGVWEKSEKSETRVEGTFVEWGTMPEEKGQGYRRDIVQLYDMINEGYSNAQIMKENPELAIHINRMDKIRLDINEDIFSEIFRNLKITYIWGATGTGKTRGIMEKHGYRKVYRVTDYAHPFEGYNRQPVICFDEFRSSLPIGDMLQYLDGYPISLPARYANRVACYETVYIVSNISLKEQYSHVQKEQQETWKAFLRRINNVIEYRKNGTIINYGSAMDLIYPLEWIDTPITEILKLDDE